MKRILDHQIARAGAIADNAKNIGFWAGPVAFLLIYYFLHPASMPVQAVTVFAITAWISVWWVTEAIPLPATSLLPIILFPIMGILKLSDTTASYADPIVFLYIGGFLIAIAIEKTGLHKRIALHIIRSMGTSLSMIVLGFMVSTAFISMWISNTATAIMMLPIGMAIITATTSGDRKEQDHFRKALMLGIAYAASIGGLGTIIGTPPNLVFAGVMRDMYQTDLSFVKWFSIGFPITIILLCASWWYLVRIGFPLKNARLAGGRAELDQRLSLTDRMSSGEKIVSVVFLTVAIAWIIRSFVLQKLIPGMDDTIIAMIGGVVLFLLPAGNKDGSRLLQWEDANKLPWGIVLLFGGGLALAEAFQASGLAQWIGQNMTGLAGVGVFTIILIVVAMVNFLTEFTSNLATVTMILPVLVPVAISAGVPPHMLMVAATLAASCGFMMPAGTPPNAIAFGSGYLSIWDMVKSGFWLNLAAIIVITMVVYFLLPIVW
ncbi:MAG: DASS family sodium-coupled anion symporter [Bacteroidota bacterium]|nr:DASS family sodium-coupled anion symporter [Bacteroidota bacterium]